MTKSIWTQERIDIIRHHWPANTDRPSILEMLNATPGPLVTDSALQSQAKIQKIVRTDTSPWTDERKAIVIRDWPTITRSEVILERVNALPGPPATLSALQTKAPSMGVKRPKELLSLMAAECNVKHQKGRGARKAVRLAQWQGTEPEVVTPDKPAPVTPAARRFNTAPRWKPGTRRNAEHYRDPKAPTSDEIAAWIAKNGVTKCPMVAVGITTATIPDADKAAISRHQDALIDLQAEQSRRYRASATKASASIASRQASSVKQRKVG